MMIKYKAFPLGGKNGLFDINTTKKKFNANTVKFGGDYPYVIRSSINNGIRGYITEDTQYLNEANTISFGQDTATIFYQKDPYFTGDKIKVFVYKDRPLNRKLAIYLITCMRKAFSSFSWGSSSFDVKILNDITIQLPVNDNDSINYNYIEERISELEEERISELEAYLKVTGLENHDLTAEDTDILMYQPTYGEFKIGNLFEIKTGRDVIIGETENGEIPLVSHQNTNNGIVKRITLLNNRTLFNYRETIALADRGVFYATCQNEDFHIGTRVKALIFKDGEKSKNIRLFFVSAINKLQLFFMDYLVNATDKLPELVIQLPITADSIPDFDYMEAYIKAQQKNIIKNVVLWKDEQINATKTVIEN